MRFRSRILVGSALVASAIGYLIYSSIRETSEYYLTVPEAQSRTSALVGQSIRVAGRVRTGSIQWQPSSLTLKFEIYPIPDVAPGVHPASQSAPAGFRIVSVGEPRPDMFADERDVIVEGRLGRDGTIAATQIMTSCPSKYRPADAK